MYFAGINVTYFVCLDDEKNVEPKKSLSEVQSLQQVSDESRTSGNTKAAKPTDLESKATGIATASTKLEASRTPEAIEFPSTQSTMTVASVDRTYRSTTLDGESTSDSAKKLTASSIKTGSTQAVSNDGSTRNPAIATANQEVSHTEQHLKVTMSDTTSGNSEAKKSLQSQAQDGHLHSANRNQTKGDSVSATPLGRQTRQKCVFIKKNGEIVRGSEAENEKLQQDFRKVMEGSGMSQFIGKRVEQTVPADSSRSETQDLTGGVRINGKAFEIRHPSIKLGQKAKVKKNSGKKELTGMSGSVKLPALETKVTGASLTTKNAKIRGASGELKLPSAEVTVGTVNLDGNSLSAAVGQVTASAKAAAVSAVKMDVKGTKEDINVKAELSATGLDLDTATAYVQGASTEAKVDASIAIKGASISGASASIKGATASLQASASAGLKGVSVNTATASVTGVECKYEAKATTQATGVDVNTGTVDVKLLRKGKGASALAEVKGGEVTVGNIKVKGIDSTVSANAQAKVAGFEVQAGNVDVKAFDGAGVHATAEIKAGVTAFNVQVGTHAKLGVTASTGFQFGNIRLVPGPPSLSFHPAFNLGFGGSSGGKGGSSSMGMSGGFPGSGGEGSASSTRNSHQLGEQSTGNRANGVNGGNEVEEATPLGNGCNGSTSNGKPNQSGNQGSHGGQTGSHGGQMGNHGGQTGGRGEQNGSHGGQKVSHGRQNGNYDGQTGGWAGSHGEQKGGHEALQSHPSIKGASRGNPLSASTVKGGSSIDSTLSEGVGQFRASNGMGTSGKRKFGCSVNAYPSPIALLEEDTSQDTPTSYQERLEYMVRRETNPILAATRQEDKSAGCRKNRSVSISALTREEAVERLTQELSSKARKLERQQATSSTTEGIRSNDGDESGTAAGDGTSRECGQQGSSSGDKHPTTTCQERHTKPKPFGPRRNIYTIHSYGDNSTKDVKAFGGRSNVVGFIDQK